MATLEPAGSQHQLPIRRSLFKAAPLAASEAGVVVWSERVKLAPKRPSTPSA